MLLGASFRRSKRFCQLLPSCSRSRKRTTPTIERSYQHNNSHGNSERSVYLCSVAVSSIIVAGSVDDDSTSEDVTPGENTRIPDSDPPPPPQVLRYLDSLYDKEQFNDLSLSLNRYSELNNDEVLWRRARAEWEVVKQLGMTGGKDATTRLKATLDLLDRALELNERNANTHRWKAIISNGYSEKLGMKEQFGNLSTMKYHLERALELNPRDGTVCTLLGVWHMELQELNWIQRKFAATFLGSVPETSYEEALEFFLRAEEVAPGAWVRNLFLIARAYLALGDRMNCKKYLELTLQQTPTIQDDHLILEEAEKLYKKQFVVLM